MNSILNQRLSLKIQDGQAILWCWAYASDNSSDVVRLMPSDGNRTGQRSAHRHCGHLGRRWQPVSRELRSSTHKCQLFVGRRGHN